VGLYPDLTEERDGDVAIRRAGEPGIKGSQDHAQASPVETGWD